MSKNCICYFSVFSTSYVFAWFVAFPGFQIMTVIYLYVVFPIFLCPPYWSTTCIELHIFFFHSAGPHHLFTWFQISIWIDSAKKNHGFERCLKKRGKGDPASNPDPTLKNLWKIDAFEGTARKRNAKQEPMTKIKRNKWHLFNASRVKVFMCVLYVSYFAKYLHGLDTHAGLKNYILYLQYPPPVCLVGCILRVQYFLQFFYF